jgi:DNA-binding XRE family transcriptional regulator
MAPNGPILPRKDTALARARQSLESVAFQIGVIVAIQRNRWEMTQSELATQVGVEQINVSNIENGRAAGISDAQIDAIFDEIDLPSDSAHANFVKWWRDNSTL